MWSDLSQPFTPQRLYLLILLKCKSYFQHINFRVPIARKQYLLSLQIRWPVSGPMPLPSSGLLSLFFFTVLPVPQSMHTLMPQNLNSNPILNVMYTHSPLTDAHWANSSCPLSLLPWFHSYSRVQDQSKTTHCILFTNLSNSDPLLLMWLLKEYVVSVSIHLPYLLPSFSPSLLSKFL